MSNNIFKSVNIIDLENDMTEFRNIGMDSENMIVPFDRQGNIIEDLSQGEEVNFTRRGSSVLKDINSNLIGKADYIKKEIIVIDEQEIQRIKLMSGGVDGTVLAAIDIVGGGGTAGSVYIPRGSVNTVADLPSLTNVGEGYTYNIKQKGETTSDFIEGAGHVIYPGTNVTAINVSTELTPVYKWDVLGGLIDMEEIDNKINSKVSFVSQVPEEPGNGDVIIYTGSNTDSLKKGGIYQYNAATSSWNFITYISNFTGATSSSAGSPGLVPAPPANSQNKVLFGDGTWGDVSVSGGVSSVNGQTGEVIIDVNKVSQSEILNNADYPILFKGNTENNNNPDVVHYSGKNTTTHTKTFNYNPSTKTLTIPAGGSLKIGDVPVGTGTISSVNGDTGPAVTITAASINAVPNDAANFPLDNVRQIPTTSSSIPSSYYYPILFSHTNNLSSQTTSPVRFDTGFRYYPNTKTLNLPSDGKITIGGNSIVTSVNSKYGDVTRDDILGTSSSGSTSKYLNEKGEFTEVTGNAKVQQTAAYVTDNNSYPVLFSSTISTDSKTEEAKIRSGFSYNPNTKTLAIPSGGKFAIGTTDYPDSFSSASTNATTSDSILIRNSSGTWQRKTLSYALNNTAVRSLGGKTGALTRGDLCDVLGASASGDTNKFLNQQGNWSYIQKIYNPNDGGHQSWFNWNGTTVEYYIDETKMFDIPQGTYMTPTLTNLGYGASVTGGYGTAIGCNAKSNGLAGIAIGSNAKNDAQGNFGIAIGENSSSSNHSIALGSSAYGGQYGISIGEGAKTYANSISIGNGSGSVYGSSSISIGGQAWCGPNSVALGTGAGLTASSNTIHLGSDNITTLTCQVALTTRSDKRDKADIVSLEDDKSLNFINKLEPIQYVRNSRELYLQDFDELSEEDKEIRKEFRLYKYNKNSYKAQEKKGTRKRVGLIAQDIQKSLEEVYGSESYANIVNDNLFDMDPDDIPEGVENQLTVAYANIIPFLIGAVKELTTELNQVKTELAELKGES